MNKLKLMFNTVKQEPMLLLYIPVAMMWVFAMYHFCKMYL